MIKIVSGGTCMSTKVFNGNGEEIEGVSKITWTIDARNKNEAARVTLEFAVAQIEAEGVMVEE